MNRVISWFSAGIASAVATKISLEKYPNCLPVYCQMNNEHPDNERFLKDCEEWFGVKIHRIFNPIFSSIEEVFAKRRYMSGIKGAPCSVELKKVPRLSFQENEDLQIYGYSYDSRDIIRAENFKKNSFELHLEYPLIEQKITKNDCNVLVLKAGIKLPAMYILGYEHNNCIGCVKSSSPKYWASIRRDFPEEYNKRAIQSREIGCKLVKLHGERIFLDELPNDIETYEYEPEESCDFLCGDLGVSSI